MASARLMVLGLTVGCSASGGRSAADAAAPVDASVDARPCVDGLGVTLTQPLLGQNCGLDEVGVVDVTLTTSPGATVTMRFPSNSPPLVMSWPSGTAPGSTAHVHVVGAGPGDCRAFGDLDVVVTTLTGACQRTDVPITCDCGSPPDAAVDGRIDAAP